MSDHPRRVALVTGAGRGIGAATVTSLLAHGYAVVALDSCAEDGPGRPRGVDYPLASRAQLDAVAANAPAHVVPVVGDVRSRGDLEEACAAAVSRFGRLDAVVAAAAVIAGGGPLWESSPDQLQALWEVDVLGVWNTAAVAVPHLLASPDPSGARLVAVSSAAGTHGLHHLAAYTTVKHAVVGIVKGLAADLVGTGVTAVAVAPGSTRTEMLQATAELYGLDGVDGFTQSQLLHRLLEPEEIAATIAFCCSREAAVLNGSVVHADGGFAP
jgi:SDR family mycofactocin-dependent oxidoreductase